jgi:hypothetical protein
MELGVEIHDVPPDGHCLYRAVADQLFSLKLIKEEEVRPPPFPFFCPLLLEPSTSCRTVS